MSAVTQVTRQASNLEEWFNVLNYVDRVPSNVQFSPQEALLYVFEDNEAVIKMIIKGRSPTMRHVSRTHRVALDWLFDRIKSSTSTPNTNLPTFQPKEISHVTNGIICCACSILAISVLQFVLKRWQKERNKIQEKNESQRNLDQ